MSGQRNIKLLKYSYKCKGNLCTHQKSWTVRLSTHLMWKNSLKHRNKQNSIRFWWRYITFQIIYFLEIEPCLQQIKHNISWQDRFRSKGKRVMETHSQLGQQAKYPKNLSFFIVIHLHWYISHKWILTVKDETLSTLYKETVCTAL
jgi:hypothetical protein